MAWVHVIMTLNVKTGILYLVHQTSRNFPCKYYKMHGIDYLLRGQEKNELSLKQNICSAHVAAVAAGTKKMVWVRDLKSLPRNRTRKYSPPGPVNNLLHSKYIGVKLNQLDLTIIHDDYGKKKYHSVCSNVTHCLKEQTPCCI